MTAYSDFFILVPLTLEISNTYLLNFDFVILLEKDIRWTFIHRIYSDYCKRKAYYAFFYRDFLTAWLFSKWCWKWMRPFLLERRTWTFREDNDTISLENVYILSAKKEIQFINIINIPDIVCMVDIHVILNHNFFLSA